MKITAAARIRRRWHRLLYRLHLWRPAKPLVRLWDSDMNYIATLDSSMNYVVTTDEGQP